MKIGFVGAGKVGFSLGKYLLKMHCTVLGYYSKQYASAKEAAEFTGTAAYSELSGLVQDCDVIFLTVPDGEIQAVYSSIQSLEISGKILCHCSGALSAGDAFPDIAASGASGCSVHPLFPVCDKYTSWQELRNAYFCIEGDGSCTAAFAELFTGFGNNVRILSPDIKTKYHAACAIASNLVCGLMAESTSLLEECGFSEADALAALKPLALNNVRRIFEDGPVNALTGPAERGDTETIRKHLSILNDGSDREIYCALTRKLTELAEIKHPDKSYTALKSLLK